MGFRVVETDNFGRDYPNEKFVEGVPASMSKHDAEILAWAINALFCTSPDSSRFWKVVEHTTEKPYVLSPGFEP